ncbi:cytochrome P450 [Serendipita vermifera]|nr:cytochrome P450 [Serendipita vermifera]
MLNTQDMLACGVAGSLALFLYCRYRSSLRRRGLTTPPGPKPLPIIGNVLDCPPNRWYETFTAWQKTYGDVIYMDLMGQPFLILNSLADPEELTNKRSNIYSSRPVHMMVTVLMYFGWSILMRQPGKEFNEQRKVFRKAIGPQVLSQYDFLAEREVDRMVSSLIGFSGDPMHQIERVVSAIVLTLGYGDKLHREYGAELADLNVRNMRHTTPIFTTFYAVTVFPWLRYIPAWFPGAEFHEVARKGKEMTQRIRDWPYGLVLQNMAKNEADPSFISNLFNSPEFTNENLRDAVALLYGGGVDTTSTACHVFLYNMVLRPDIQRKIQKGIDDNIGRGRLLTASEAATLSYFQAAWKESLCLDPPVPLGVPHVTSQDDAWNGYFIPKGTLINCNIGFMLRDPRIWGDDADVFRPERFLEESTKDLPDISMVPFGFGKRICPGRWMAERLGSVLLTSILAIYDVGLIPGETMPDRMIWQDSAVRRPLEFRCQFKPRS